MTCTSCGSINADGSRFCTSCGSRLLDDAAVVSGRERKTVTVLFCDLVGFTAWSDGADPEDVQAVLSPYHARARAEIERFGGTVEKFIGDAVMAAFGAPLVHEDDPERAVRAGLRLLEVIEELSDRHGGGLAVRIGIATGEAVVTTGARAERGEGMLARDVVNTAARLQTAAPVGAVVVGEATWRATRAAIEYAGLDAVHVKGKADPVVLWRAIVARGRVGEALADTQTALVGRRRELEALQRMYARSVRDSSLQFVTVVGEPGVGKSRLVQEMAAWLESRDELVTWRQGRCLPYGEGITFWALGQVVKAHAGILDTDPSGVASTKLRDTVATLEGVQGVDRGWLVARLSPLVGLPGTESSQEERFTAWERFIEAIAATGPVVIVLEDLHLARAGLLAFCDHLLHRMTGVPVLLIATARPELFDTTPMWTGRSNATTITLDPLTDAETALLVGGLIGERPVPMQTREVLLRRAEGNPLYAVEFVRMLLERHDPARDQDSPDPTGRGLDGFPETVHAIIEARLDTLAASSKVLLADAAVIGVTFWSGAVAALSHREESSVRDVLRELSGRSYLRPSRVSSVAGQVEYTFSHALISEVAYARIPRADRAMKHQLAAAWLTGELPPDPLGATGVGDATGRGTGLLRLPVDPDLAGGAPFGGERAAVIGYHWHRALTMASAAGAADVASLVGQARFWATVAGDHAANLDAEAASNFYSTALELTENDDDPDRPHLLFRRGTTSSSAGRLTEADLAFAESETLHRRQGHLFDAAHAATSRAFVLIKLGRSSEARRLVDQLVDELERLPPGPELVLALAARARQLMLDNRLAESVAVATHALELAARRTSDADRPAVMLARRILGMSRYFLGDVGGEQDIRDALEIAVQLGQTQTEVIMISNLGAVVSTRSPEAGLRYFDRALDLAVSRGLHDSALFQWANRAENLRRLGRWDEALRQVDEPLAAYADADATRPVEFLLVTRGRILAQRGDVDGAERVASVILPLGRESGDPSQVIETVLLAVTTARQRNDADAASRLTAELVELLEPDLDAGSSESLAELARALVPAEHAAVVERIIAAAPMMSPESRSNVLSARAVVTEAAGDLHAAAALYREAAAGWRDFGDVFEEAIALLGLGRCLLHPAAGGRPGTPPSVLDDAAAALTRARATFARLRTPVYLAETDALLRKRRT